MQVFAILRLTVEERAMSKPKDETVGQPRRATDSRPRQGSETPEIKVKQSQIDAPPAEKGDRKPSSSGVRSTPAGPLRNPRSKQLPRTVLRRLRRDYPARVS